MSPIARKLRVAIADDQPEILQQLRNLLELEFDVVALAPDGRQLLEAARLYQPDVVISDINMPFLSGIEACRIILGEALSRAAVILTMYNFGHFLRLASDAGARGYVLKIDAAEELIDAVRKVFAGENYLSRHVRPLTSGLESGILSRAADSRRIVRDSSD